MQRVALVLLVVAVAVLAADAGVSRVRRFDGIAVGGKIHPYLLAWNGEDRRSEPVYFADDSNKGAARFYARTNSALNWAGAAAAHGEGSGQAVGWFAYGETAGQATAWGANLIGVSYSGAAAIGAEVNGVNRSGKPATVAGINIVNGGNAATYAALLIDTSTDEPQGKPRFGIYLAGSGRGNPSAPASDTGLLIDEIDSGEAIRIADDHRIALTRDGKSYLKFDSASHTIQLVKDGAVVAAW